MNAQSSSDKNPLKGPDFQLSNPAVLSCIYVQSVPGVGDDKKEDDGMTREEQQEQEKLRL